jgi:hypothetical protein
MITPCNPRSFSDDKKVRQWASASLKETLTELKDEAHLTEDSKKSAETVVSKYPTGQASVRTKASNCSFEHHWHIKI